MQVPILNGIYADSKSHLRTSYPINMVPVPKASGVSAGYLRPAEGSVKAGDGLGEPRGGINWNGACYRVMGSKLVRVNSDWTVTVLGDVGNDGRRVTMDYSFDRLAIASNGNLFYWNGAALSQVTDPELGTVLSMCWIDGYFMTTDGTSLVVTDLGNPMSVDPLKYGSSEIDPDPILAVLKLRNEIYAVNRNTIEVFDNMSGTGFPFARIEGAQITKGALGTHCACVYFETIAFIGGGRNQPPSIYLGVNAGTARVSTREVDEILASYGELELSRCVLEARSYGGHEVLMVRLPDRTLVYDAAASQAVEAPVWYVLTSSATGFEAYRAVDHVWCYDRWLVCDLATGDHGYLTEGVASHFGQIVRWEFGTQILYNGSRGALFLSMELVSLTGWSAAGDDPQISTSYSVDGVSWSQERPIRTGGRGDRMHRLVWMQQGRISNWRVQRFRGDSRVMVSPMRLEAILEALS